MESDRMEQVTWTLGVFSWWQDRGGEDQDYLDYIGWDSGID